LDFGWFVYPRRVFWFVVASLDGSAFSYRFRHHRWATALGFVVQTSQNTQGGWNT
jgi:hypothetical protein